MSLAVVTIVAGRRAHLARQLEGLQRQSRSAEHLVIVRMDGAEITVPPRVAEQVVIVDMPSQGGELPLAAARNLGARATHAEHIVFLDVDCIPGEQLVETYADASSRSTAWSVDRCATWNRLRCRTAGMSAT